jgi:hypothetical protein
MQVTILERDIQAGTARIRFSHNGVTHTNSYDLRMVVPGTALVFAQYGVAFDEAKQQLVIDKLTAQIEREIEAGMIRNPL